MSIINAMSCNSLQHIYSGCFGCVSPPPSGAVCPRVSGLQSGNIPHKGVYRHQDVEFVNRWKWLLSANSLCTFLSELQVKFIALKGICTIIMPIEISVRFMTDCEWNNKSDRSHRCRWTRGKLEGLIQSAGCQC